MIKNKTKDINKIMESKTNPSASLPSEAREERLQRHRSLHSKAQSKNSRRVLDNNNSPHHRRAVSVRVRPTYLLEAGTFEGDQNLPKPPVSINVASPEDEDCDNLNTLGHR